MFSRQFLSSSSQQGLTQVALDLEIAIRDSLFDSWKLLHNSVFLTQDYRRRQALRLHHLSTRTDGPIRLYFESFWNKFNPETSYLFHLASHAASDLSSSLEVVVDPLLADVSIHSCFGKSPQSPFNHTTRVLYLGENVRPDYSIYDYSLTTDIYTYLGRNSYLPVWQVYFFDSFKSSSSYRFDNVIEDLIQTCRKSSKPWKSRQIDVTYVGNNNQPNRVAAIKVLQKLDLKIELYGSSTRPVESKHHLYGNSKFVLCPENSFYPGYVTEKILEPIFCGSIAIYDGSLSDELRTILSPLMVNLNDVLNDSFDPSFPYIENLASANQTLFEDFMRESALNYERNAINLFKTIFQPYIRHLPYSF